MSDDAATGLGVAAWMLARVLATELAESGAIPPKRMRKLVSSLLEVIGDLDRTVELSPEAQMTIRRRLEELRRSPSLNPRDTR